MKKAVIAEAVFFTKDAAGDNALIFINDDGKVMMESLEDSDTFAVLDPAIARYVVNNLLPSVEEG